MKPNCYKCIHRGNVPGDAHSRCLHPDLGDRDNNPFGDMIDLLQGKHNSSMKKLNIKGNAHGIRSGWFLWPSNFDPVWLEQCDGFETKEVVEKPKNK